MSDTEPPAEPYADLVGLLLVAPPAGGKGTQARRLAAHYAVVHLSSGEMLRENVDEGTRIGKAAAVYLDRGDLVPDELVLEMLAAPILEAVRNGGFVLDGFPRTVRQARRARQLAQLLGGFELSAVVHLVVGREELHRRFLGRARREGRADDSEAVMAHRLDVYYTQTAPMLDYYSERGLVVTVDGEQTIEKVFSDIVSSVDAVRTSRTRRSSE
jgi:adenylate kinase